MARLFVPNTTQIAGTWFCTPTWGKFFQDLVSTVPITGSHVDRVSAQSPPAIGAIWFETERTCWYLYTAQGWVYQTGTMRTTLANAPVDLGPGDAGLLLEVVDFGDLVQWTGEAWTLAPGAVPPGTEIGIMAGTTPPAGPAWAPEDGMDVTILTVSATLGSVNITTPVSAGTWVKR